MSEMTSNTSQKADQAASAPASVGSVTMSDSAATKINAIMAKEGVDKFLRVSVNGGGCSGFAYDFGFAESAQTDDLLIEHQGAKILIDEISLEFLKGSEIDYVNELIGAAFKIHNPNAVASCGCGTSFSI